MKRAQLNQCLYHLCWDGRITTKQLGKKIRSSQQVASYLVQRVQEKEIVHKFIAVVDPSRLGLITIATFYYLTDFSEFAITQVLSFLSAHPYIVHVERMSEGADLYVEFCVPNLSLYNKQSQEILHELRSYVKLNGIHPVVVKHQYPKNYLRHVLSPVEFILSGDRDQQQMTVHEKQVLASLLNNARIPVLQLAQHIGQSTRSIIASRKSLEQKRIVRYYSAHIDFEKAHITRQLVLLSINYSDLSDIDRFSEFCKMDPNIVSMQKLLGEYEVMVVIEETNQGGTVNRLRSTFAVRDFRLMRSERVHKQTTLPSAVFEI